jgi:hypothetical protein
MKPQSKAPKPLPPSEQEIAMKKQMEQFNLENIT